MGYRVRTLSQANIWSPAMETMHSAHTSSEKLRGSGSIRCLDAPLEIKWALWWAASVPIVGTIKRKSTGASLRDSTFCTDRRNLFIKKPFRFIELHSEVNQFSYGLHGSSSVRVWGSERGDFKTTYSCDMRPCIAVDTCRCFVGSWCLRLPNRHGGRFLRNSAKLLRNCAML